MVMCGGKETKRRINERCEHTDEERERQLKTKDIKPCSSCFAFVLNISGLFCFLKIGYLRK